MIRVTAVDNIHLDEDRPVAFDVPPLEFGDTGHGVPQPEAP